MTGVGWVLAGPASKENGGAAHTSLHGLLAYGAGSSVIVADVRSMQLVVVLPMPALKVSPLLPAPFVTAVQWDPEGIQRDVTQDVSSTAHLQLAAGDRHGRIAIWDVAAGEVGTWLELEADKGRQGIQDLCWVCGQPLLLAAIHGPSLIVIWNMSSGHYFWKFDAGSEMLGCIRCDPFDSRQMCVMGLKGLLLSILVTGTTESEVLVKQYSHPGPDEKGVSSAVGEKGVKDGLASSSGGGSTSAGAPALASAPGCVIRCMFSTRTRGLLYIMLPREIVVFDLVFGMPLASTALPRGCGKFLELLADVDGDILYCAHQDGKVSAWKRRADMQVFALCYMETLIPLMGSSALPTVLAVVHHPMQLHVQTFEGNQASALQLNTFLPLNTLPVPQSLMMQDSNPIEVKPFRSLDATILSISDDGRLWQWLISAAVPGTDEGLAHMNGSKEAAVHLETSTHTGIAALDLMANEEQQNRPPLSSSNGVASELVFKLELKGQLQLLSAAITTLAVAIPSLHALSPGGNNSAAISIPLVALATQAGTVELVDTAANAITASYTVHNAAIVRGVRWLGNTRLVSFSYTEVKGKGGGFVNRLVVTCVRSGQSKPFRVLQKPERAPMRALRTSPSGRYLLILFREAPAEIWAMTRTPQMLRSLALPFTVMEWALPPVPRSAASARKSTLLYRDRPTIASAVAAANAPLLSPTSPSTSDSLQESESAESFAFALVNGSLGVFEMRGRRVRDFKPRWPAAAFVSADVLVTAMAYRTPHVVMGDRLGSIRWWDVTTGLSSFFNTHRGGIRRIKFAPVRIGDSSRGRIAVLFNDHSFAVYDLDTQDPLANALVQPQLGGILVLELEWNPLRTDRNEPLMLCIAGADSSFRLLEVQNVTGGKSGQVAKQTVWQRYRPMPLCSAALLPPPHALSLRVLLQQGVQPSWFSLTAASMDEELVVKSAGQPLGTRGGDLRHYLLETSTPMLGETVFAEVLLKTLEPYRKAGELHKAAGDTHPTHHHQEFSEVGKNEGCWGEAGRLLDEERRMQYTAVCRQGVATRCAFAAAQFGEYPEAGFWLQLPRALALLSFGSAGPTAFWGDSERTSSVPPKGSSLIMLNEEGSIVNSDLLASKSLDKGMTFITPKVLTPISPNGVLPSATFKLPYRCMDIVPSDQLAVYMAAQERILWHEKLGGTEATQKRVHELISVGDLEAAVTILLATPPNNPLFYMDALRAVSLASAVSPALHELAVKVVAANMVGTEDSLSGTHLLCAVGRYQEACSQLQDAGRWIDAATLAATHLEGSDHARVLERWAEHVLHNEHNLWRAMMLYVAAGALMEALDILRKANQPDTAAMFLLACHEAKVSARASMNAAAAVKDCPPMIVDSKASANTLDLPGKLPQHFEEIQAVCEYYGQYQRLLAHMCTGITAFVD